MGKKSLFLCVALALAAMVGLGSRAPAAAYPNKEIRVVVAFAAGGQSDLTARKITEIIQKYKLLPQTVLVVNMPGANTMNGLRAVNEAKPDGYTFLIHHTDLVAQNLSKIIPLSYHDFDMVCQIMDINFVISAKGDAPWNNAREFAADAKKNSGKFAFSGPAVGGATYLAGMMFLEGAGIMDDVVIRPADGGADSATALMAGTVKVRVAPASDVARFVKAGQEKVLFLLDDKAKPEFPGADLAPSLGLQVIKHSSGIFAPKGTPKEIKDTFAAAIKAAIETKDFQDFMAFQVANPKFLTGAEWEKLYEQIEKTFSAIMANMKQ